MSLFCESFARANFRKFRVRKNHRRQQMLAKRKIVSCVKTSSQQTKSATPSEESPSKRRTEELAKRRTPSMVPYAPAAIWSAWDKREWHCRADSASIGMTQRTVPITLRSPNTSTRVTKTAIWKYFSYKQDFRNRRKSENSTRTDGCAAFKVNKHQTLRAWTRKPSFTPRKCIPATTDCTEIHKQHYWIGVCHIYYMMSKRTLPFYCLPLL